MNAEKPLGEPLAADRKLYVRILAQPSEDILERTGLVMGTVLEVVPIPVYETMLELDERTQITNAVQVARPDCVWIMCPAVTRTVLDREVYWAKGTPKPLVEETKSDGYCILYPGEFKYVRRKSNDLDRKKGDDDFGA